METKYTFPSRILALILSKISQVVRSSVGCIMSSNCPKGFFPTIFPNMEDIWPA